MANTLDFEEEFYKVTGAAQIERFRKEGIVVSDATMKHIFFNVPKWVSFEKTANAF